MAYTGNICETCLPDTEEPVLSGGGSCVTMGGSVRFGWVPKEQNVLAGSKSQSRISRDGGQLCFDIYTYQATLAGSPHSEPPLLWLFWSLLSMGHLYPSSLDLRALMGVQALPLLTRGQPTSQGEDGPHEVSVLPDSFVRGPISCQ